MSIILKGISNTLSLHQESRFIRNSVRNSHVLLKTSTSRDWKFSDELKISWTALPIEKTKQATTNTVVANSIIYLLKYIVIFWPLGLWILIPTFQYYKILGRWYKIHVYAAVQWKLKYPSSPSYDLKWSWTSNSVQADVMVQLWPWITLHCRNVPNEVAGAYKYINTHNHIIKPMHNKSEKKA